MNAAASARVSSDDELLQAADGIDAYTLGYDPRALLSDRFLLHRRGGDDDDDHVAAPSAEAVERSSLTSSHAKRTPIHEVLMDRPSVLAHDLESADTESLRQQQPPSASSSPPPSTHTHAHTVNPATIPIRTSSHNAANGDRNSHSPARRLSRNKILGSVPEDRRYSHRAIVDERNWLSQGRNIGSSARAPQSPTSPTSMNQQQMTASPRSADVLRTVGADLIDGPGSHWSPEKENILKGPFEYLEAQPGKDIRTQLIAAFNEWLRVPAASLAIITRVVGMLHTASLLVDDVEDNSNLRRGNPVAHSIFGTAQTINSANYIYFCALEELLKLNSTDVVRIYTEELLNLHRGQGMDLFWRDTLTCPSEDDYLEMVGNKTGGLFRLAIKLMCAESPSHHFDGLQTANSPDEPSRQTDYIPLVNTIGLLFQILDDYRNLSDTAYTANKGLCEDLTEGKFSFPIIHSIRSDPSNLQLINILRQKTTDDDVKRYALSYMESTGSFSYTRRVLRGLTKKALALVDELDNGKGKADTIRNILDKLRVDRSARERGASDL